MKRMLQLSVRVNVVKTRFICDKLFIKLTNDKHDDK